MLAILFSLVISGVSGDLDDALAAAPFDLVIGAQQVELRRPLINQMPGARLVLFARPGAGAGATPPVTLSQFKHRYPVGSVQATLQDGNGARLALTHTDYVFYKGSHGLVLTVSEATAERRLFNRLALESQIALQGVRAVWVDRRGRSVRDLNPNL